MTAGARPDAPWVTTTTGGPAPALGEEGRNRLWTSSKVSPPTLS
jgi:hypothetical protein